MHHDLGRTLLALGLIFVPLSLLSFGGGVAILADVEQQTVVVQGWITQSNLPICLQYRARRRGPGRCSAL